MSDCDACIHGLPCMACRSDCSRTHAPILINIDAVAVSSFGDSIRVQVPFAEEYYTNIQGHPMYALFDLPPFDALRFGRAILRGVSGSLARRQEIRDATLNPNPRPSTRQSE